VTRFFDGVHAQRRAVALLFAGLILLGFVAALKLPNSILPEVTFPRISIVAESGELPSDAMLWGVTRPLEESIRRVPGVLEVRSTTSRGSAEINLDCAWGSDMNLTLQRTQAQIEAVRPRLAPGTTLEARLMNPTLFPVVGISLTSDRTSLAALRDFAVLVLKPELSRLPGVAEVIVQGGRRLEARVLLDPGALQARGLDAAGVADAIRGTSVLESVGLLDANSQLYLGLADGRPANLEALRSLPISVASGPPVPLAQLGRISVEPAPEFVRYRAQSREAVLVNLLRQPSASAITLSDAAHRWMQENRGRLPAGARIQYFYDQSDLVRASAGSVRDSLLVGALLAALVVVFFLRSLRLGLGGALALPGSVALTLIGLHLTHQSLNMMTLGGIAAAVGLVLDDAIVVVEHLTARSTGPGAVPRSRAMAEIVPTMIGSSLCTVAIFLPFLFLGGVTGAFFRVLSLSMVLMLTASLALCLTVVPLLSPRVRHHSATPGAGGRWLATAVRYASEHAWIGVAGVLLFVGLAVPLQRTLGTGFLPAMDEGALILDYASPPGTSVEETDRMLQGVEQEIARVPEIQSWSRRTGDQLGFFITEPNIGDYVLRLRPHRRRSADEVADELRGRIRATQPALQIEFGQLVEDVIGDLTTNPQPIEIRAFDEDRVVAEGKARDVAALLRRIRGVVDVKSGVVVSGPNVSIVPSPAAARLGLGAGDLARAVSPAVNGVEAGRIIRGARAWPIRVVLPRSIGLTGAAELAGIGVPVGTGRRAILADLATLRTDPGETEVHRDNLRTMVAVTARLSGRDLGSAMGEIRQLLKRDLALPRDATIQYGGLYAEQQSSFRGLAAVLLGATALVFLILMLSFRSWAQPLSVLAVVASSLAGVFAALHLAGATFNISSFVGAIMMVGIVAENAYFLVAAYRAALAAGRTQAEAARDGAMRRARPVLMTTFAGVAALSPLALGLGAGSALLKPLAVAVVGGFVTSAFLLLVVLPSLLARFGGGLD
jgi:multidrug efflux pump subunit AcrB